MQDPDREETKKVEIGGLVGVDRCFENPIGNGLQGMKDLEKTGSLKVEYGGTDENAVDNRNEIGGVDGIVKSDEIKDCGIVYSIKTEPDEANAASTCCDDHSGKTKNSCGDESCLGKLRYGNFGMESSGCSIEEGLEKVNLVGNGGGLVVTANAMNEKGIASAGGGNDLDGDSGSSSGSETSAVPSSASTTSSESDDDDEEEGKDKSCKIMRHNAEEQGDIEEGEITGSVSEKMIPWSDNDDDDDGDEDDNADDGDEEVDYVDVDEGSGDLSQGPITSKNELMVLPPVPPVNIILQPCHQILPVGVVSSILGAQVIVEGAEKHNPLSEGSILWISETRLPLGTVDEIFGPVKNPYYIVRYNSESEVPSEIQNGTLIGFVPEFVDHVLNDKCIYQKGYDASGENDEEMLDEVEFSDDEKEAEYKRSLKTSKRGNNQKPGNRKKNRKNFKKREMTWTKDQSSASQAPSPTVVSSQPKHVQHHVRAPVPSPSQGKPSGPPSSGPIFPSGPTAFAHQVQPPGFLLNGLWANANPFQQQNMTFPGVFQMTGMSMLQQNPPQAQQMPFAGPALLQQQFFPQMPGTNPAPSQQPFDLSQLVSGNSASPLGLAPFAGVPAMPASSPWSGLLGSNLSNQAQSSLLGVSAQLSGFPGVLSNEPPQAGQSGNPQPATATSYPVNTGIHPQFNQGLSSGGGRGRGRTSFHRRGGGGRFGGGRGRQ